MKSTFIHALIAAASLAGCVGDDLGLDVDDERDARFDALRARLAVDVRPGADGYGGSESCDQVLDETAACCNSSYCSPRGLATQLFHGCVDSGSPSRDRSTCGAAVISAEASICAAQRLLQLIENPGDQALPARVDTTSGGTLRIGPQDAESNTELALEAFRFLAQAQWVTGNAMERTPPAGGAGGTPCSRADFARPAGSGAFAELTLGQELAHFYAESLQIAEDAADLLARASSAVSDAELSRATDRAEAALLRNAPFASRAAAAHALVGGAHGLTALTDDEIDGLFTRPPLSRSGQQALELLRTVAIDPALVVDTSIPTDELVVGGSRVDESAPARASIRYRLTRYFGEPALASASAPEIYERAGIDARGLSEARAWIAGEIRAFSRPAAASGPRRARTVPAERLPDGTMSDFPLFAATRIPPQQPLEVYWTAVVRYDPTPVVTPVSSLSSWPFGPSASGALPAGATWGDEGSSGGLATITNRSSGRTYASIREDSVLRARRLLGVLSPRAGDSVALRGALISMRETIAGSQPDGLGGGGTIDDGAFLGRARICGYNFATSTPPRGFWIELDLTVMGVTSPAGLAVVLGQDGVECAVRATIDGVACTPAELADRAATVLLPFTPVPGGRLVTIVESAPGTGPSDTLSAFFVVRRDPAAGGAAMPGQYEALTGFIVPDSASETLACTGGPITPDLYRDVTELIAPSTEDPGRSETNCAGLPDDLRLPLENELISDSFPEESSWRHFLTSARSSATEADALGDDLVRLGLEMDLRAEAQADALERLCGVRLNVTAFAREVPPRVALPSGPGGTSCEDGYRYVPEAAQCVLDPVRWAERVGAVRSEDVNRLEQCVGSDATIDWVPVGDQSLCLWQIGDDPTTLCEGEDSVHPCPRVVPSASDPAQCLPYLPTLAGVRPLVAPDANALRLFQIPPTPTIPGDDAPSVLPCEALARLRARDSVPSGDDPDREAVLGSSLLLAPIFRTYASKLGWEALAGNFSRVTYGGSTIASTGSLVSVSAVHLWPEGRSLGGLDVAMDGLCAGDRSTDPQANDDGLFCVYAVPTGNSESERLPRARANDMLARAVIAARVMAGESLAGVIALPYFPRALSSSTRNLEDAALTDTYFEARFGDLMVDQAGDEPGAQPTSFTDLVARAEWSSAATEWDHCYYDRDSPDSCTASVDVSDPASGLPLIIRRVAENVDGSSGTTSLSRVFFDDTTGRHGVLHGYVEALASRSLNLDRSATSFESDTGTAALDGSDRLLTDYFRRGFVVGWDAAYGGCDGCACEERALGCIRGFPDVDIRSTYQGNHFHISAPNGGLTPRDMLNGLELTCAAARIASDDPSFGCDEPPEVRSLRDLLQAEAFLRCKAEQIEARAGASVLSSLPVAIVEGLRESGPTTLGGDSGEIAAQVAGLRGAFEELATARFDMADEGRQIAAQIRQLRSAVAQSEISREIEDLSLQSTIWNQITSCMVAVASIPSSDTATVVGRGIAAAATCVNSVAQVILASRITDLRNAAERERLESTFASFDLAVVDAMRRMSEIATSIQQQFAAIDAALSRLNAIRTEGRRALARALYLESDGADDHSAVSTVYRARYNTLLTRYRAAHDRAVRAAYIARRAVEQRLAMPLETITDDLPTVEAPESWVDAICTLPSIDYEALRGAPTPDGSPGPAPLGPEGYSGSYVGDYVTRLEQVVESYNFVFPFREGTDTVVISLRDDVAGVRAECEVETPNLLYQSGHLDILATGGAPGWERYGCVPVLSEEPDASTVDAHCVSARPITPDEDDAYWPPASGGADFGLPNGFRVRFGGSAAATPDTSLAQRVTLEEGRYRLSWYERSSLSPMPGQVIVTTEGGAVLSDSPPRQTAIAGGWSRFHTFVDIAGTQRVLVRIVPAGPGGPSTTPGGGGSLSDGSIPASTVDVGGIMLENVTRSVVGDPYREIPDPFGSGTVVLADLAAPGPYFATGATRARLLRDCIDYTGESFRAEAWTRGCTRVCPDGYDAACDDRVARSRCYYQTTIPIQSSFVERVLTGTPAGFAAGNYNYRIETIGLNVVGTGLRICDGRPGCYGSGNVSYSLLHTGPYIVRNARGETYSAPLFPGRMESARALGAERYITNPISSADQALIGPYQRPDFSGRPLGGSLVLRIWDEPTLDFDRIEDVQLVLGYRYWQRQR